MSTELERQERRFSFLWAALIGSFAIAGYFASSALTGPTIPWNLFVDVALLSAALYLILGTDLVNRFFNVVHPTYAAPHVTPTGALVRVRAEEISGQSDPGFTSQAAIAMLVLLLAAMDLSFRHDRFLIMTTIEIAVLGALACYALASLFFADWVPGKRYGARFSARVYLYLFKAVDEPTEPWVEDPAFAHLRKAAKFSSLQRANREASRARRLQLVALRAIQVSLGAIYLGAAAMVSVDVVESTPELPVLVVALKSLLALLFSFVALRIAARLYRDDVRGAISGLYYASFLGTLDNSEVERCYNAIEVLRMVEMFPQLTIYGLLSITEIGVPGSPAEPIP